MKNGRGVGRPVVLLLGWSLVAGGLLYGLSHAVGGLPPMGSLLDPVDGLYRTARLAEHPEHQELAIDLLEAPVTVVRDERGVPHIFAGSDRDAIVALGYVVAQDRLFQLDFLPRVASGRLSEVFGEASLEADRFLRRTGMDWGARENARRILEEGGLEQDLVTWFAAGANAYIDALDDEALPFEFRLLGYRPDRYTALSTARLLQYFAYDLTYRTDGAYYTALRERLGDEAYARLYPQFQPLFVPIIPEQGGGAGPAGRTQAALGAALPGGAGLALAVAQEALRGTLAEGFVQGKGSNNWVVHGTRTETGAPLLAGDMHLSLSLPAIWYEVHLVTPTMNTYGVCAPGTPLPVEAFTDHVAWAFTNTGADVIDHYALTLDDTGTRYRYQGGFRDLEVVPDTIWIKGGPPVLDTLYYAHWGPVLREGDTAVAIRWTAHEPSRTLQALWGMNHASDLVAFEAALRQWDTPMQNIAQADVKGNIAIRSTGYLPIRRAGHGIGLLDGSTDAYAWMGRVPFEDLPHSANPAQGFLSSTNQQPADSTYPYYLGHDWRSSYRSLRIDSLLRARPKHSVDDFKAYQADVHAVQRDLFVPLLDTLAGLSPGADSLRMVLRRWNGSTGLDRVEPLLLDEVLGALGRLAWDEAVFDGLSRPAESVLYGLLRSAPQSPWLDVQATPAREDAAGLLRLALEAASDTLAARYGPGPWPHWGEVHQVVFRHMTQTPALRPLWRGPYPFPGFAATLSPAGSRLTTHSASWRVVVDLSQVPPVGYGIFAGGASGNPFSRYYDLQVQPYLDFTHYALHKPTVPEDLDPAQVSSRLLLLPKTRE